MSERPYDKYIVAGLREQLPDAACKEFDAVIAEATERGLKVDQLPVVTEFFKASIVECEALPSHLHEIERVGRARRYGMQLELNPRLTNPEQMRRFQELWRLKCEQAFQLTKSGLSDVEAWSRVDRLSRHEVSQ